MTRVAVARWPSATGWSQKLKASQPRKSKKQTRCLDTLTPGLSCGMWDLVPRTGIEPGPSASGAGVSQWTTREVPILALELPDYRPPVLGNDRYPYCFHYFESGFLILEAESWPRKDGYSVSPW